MPQIYMYKLKGLSTNQYYFGQSFHRSGVQGKPSFTWLTPMVVESLPMSFELGLDLEKSRR